MGGFDRGDRSGGEDSKRCRRRDGGFGRWGGGELRGGGSGGGMTGGAGDREAAGREGFSHGEAVGVGGEE